jgi:hypothetical protein
MVDVGKAYSLNYVFFYELLWYYDGMKHGIGICTIVFVVYITKFYGILFYYQ